MKKIHILLLLLTFGLIGCKRDVDEDRPNYYGDIWEEQEKERQEAYAKDIPLRYGTTPVETSTESIEDRMINANGYDRYIAFSDIPKAFDEFSKDEQEILLKIHAPYTDKLEAGKTLENYFYNLLKTEKDYQTYKKEGLYDGPPFLRYYSAIFKEPNHTKGSLMYGLGYQDKKEPVFGITSSEKIIDNQGYKPLKTSNYDPFKKETDNSTSLRE